MLASKGFTEAVDATGDVYYVGPYSRLIWLYSDGKWSGDKAAEGSTLEEYLNEIPKQEIPL